MFKQLLVTVSKLAGSRKAVATGAGSGGAITLGSLVFALLTKYSGLDPELALAASGLIATAIMYGVGSFVKAQGVADAGDEFYGMSGDERRAKVSSKDSDMLVNLLEGKSKA